MFCGLAACVRLRREAVATQPLALWSDQIAPARAPAPVPPRLSVVECNGELSDLEWSVASLAERDSLSSLREPGPLRRLMTQLFGIPPVNRLANERLEALRRMAVLIWRYHWNVPEREVQAFVGAGYSQPHYELLQHRIAAARSQRGRRTPL